MQLFLLVSSIGNFLLDESVCTLLLIIHACMHLFCSGCRISIKNIQLKALISGYEIIVIPGIGSLEVLRSCEACDLHISPIDRTAFSSPKTTQYRIAATCRFCLSLNCRFSAFFDHKSSKVI